jgi:hypothetical protein
MKIKQICTSLEISKQLKRAGYPQESLFYWETVTDKHNVAPRLVRYSRLEPSKGTYNNGDEYEENWFAAPTAEELLGHLDIYYPKALKRTLKKINDKIYFTDLYLDFGKEINRDLVFFSTLNGAADSTNFFQGGEIFKFDKIKLPVFKDKSLANVLAKMWLYLKKNNLLTK